MTRQRRNTCLFVGFLLIAGLANMAGRMLPPAWESLTTCLINVTYTGLLIFWLESVRVRLLPSRARTYMCAAACLMLLHVFLRLFGYSIALTTTASRYVRYAYWIPQTMIPALFCMVSLRIRRGVRERGAGGEVLLLIPAALLAAMALTSDLHGLVYVPWVAPEQFQVASGTYGYHAGFYILNAWMVLTVLAGIVLLFREVGRLPRATVLLFAADIALWFGILLLNVLFLSRPQYSAFRFFNAPEANIFGMLGVFEIAIRGRLIPHNRNYAGFFAHLQMPVLITDGRLRSVHTSAAAVPAGRGALHASLAAPVYVAADRKLCGKRIPGGYAFWVEDEAAIHAAQERLIEANQTIEQENTLIEAETRQKEEHARIAARNRIYHEIAAEMHPVQRRIGELLDGADPGMRDFPDTIARVCVLGAYVKRKTNLLLLASEKPALSTYELYLALGESAGYLAYCGLRVSVAEPDERPLPAATVVHLYDAFEKIAEQLMGRATSLMVSVNDEGLRLAAQTDVRPDVHGVALQVRFFESDDILYIDVEAAEGGASA